MEVPIENVLRMSCFDESGNGASRDSIGAYPIDFGGPCAASSALVSSGYWTKTPYGTKNIPKNEAESPISGWLSYESVKHLAKWSEAFAAPLTGDLEIVPLHDPFSLGEGDKLRLLVALEGKPATGAIVVYDGKPRGETDSEGHVSIKLRRSGLQTILASYRTPLESEKADEVVRTAVLSFALEEKP
jgi:nickel transport protein